MRRDILPVYSRIEKHIIYDMFRVWKNPHLALTLGYDSGMEDIRDVGLRLTDAERRAIQVAIGDYELNDMDAGCWHIANTLRDLLERLK